VNDINDKFSDELAMEENEENQDDIDDSWDFKRREDNSGIVFRRLVIFTSPTFYSLSTSVALFNKILT
jgi:hypothetical protein